MDINRVTVPLFELDSEGAILPNYLFHRSFDYVHSRCIEYPFAASQVLEAERLLDVGSVKADKVWINWLESLPLEVHATDYDEDSLGVFRKAKFQQADVRKLPYPDNHFDIILAVSVIEHIGLDLPQVNHELLPSHEEEGDVTGVAELLRVLKPNGRLVMTFPYSAKTRYEERMKSARIYNEERLAKFNALAQPEQLDYYEYQHMNRRKLFLNQPMKSRPSVRKSFYKALHHFVPQQEKTVVLTPVEAALPGRVTWRRIPRAQGAATNLKGHVDGLICGLWRKQEQNKA
jgi:SAM-dependent methyltransferase